MQTAIVYAMVLFGVLTYGAFTRQGDHPSSRPDDEERRYSCPYDEERWYSYPSSPSSPPSPPPPPKRKNKGEERRRQRAKNNLERNLDREECQRGEGKRRVRKFFESHHRDQKTWTTILSRS